MDIFKQHPCRLAGSSSTRFTLARLDAPNIDLLYESRTWVPPQHLTLKSPVCAGGIIRAEKYNRPETPRVAGYVNEENTVIRDPSLGSHKVPA
jgi:hypothetical protein